MESATDLLHGAARTATREDAQTRRPAPFMNPYVAGIGLPGTGAVGIQFTGSYATADAEVTISRPAYNGVPASSEIISQINF